jgi:hypothetical protein
VGKWLTPEDDSPVGTVCRTLVIPDDLEWRAIVNGCLSLITDAWNFEQHGSATPEQVAARFTEMFHTYLSEECGAVSDFIIIQETKPSGTYGGTFTQGADRTRALNTEVLDTGNHASLSANQITLQPGTYRGSAWASAWYVGAHRLKLYNVTDAITVVGSSEWIPQANQQTGNALLSFQFTITAAKVFELRHRCTATAENAGFGFSSGLGTEIYAEIKLERIGD